MEKPTESVDPLRLALEEAQKARKEAEQANRLKDEFLATISHELRTPLTAILGWSKILQTRQHDPSTMTRAIETIERNAKGLAQIVEDILDVSRIINGKLRLELGPVDLRVVLAAAIDVMRPTALAKGVALPDLAPGPACVVSGDPDRLQQVVWNLLSNAVKFTPRGGLVEAWIEPCGAQVLIRVRDTGQGFRPDFLPYLFNRFRQEDGTTTRHHGGLGMGLAIVRHLAELHGGSVKAESEGEGRGATFTVTLPIPEVHDERSLRFPAPPEVAVETPRPTALRGMRILAVEHEADARDILTMVLEGEGAMVTTAASVGEAMARFAEEPPDVLVCSLTMPGAEEQSLIRRVRALPKDRGGRVAAVALTPYAREVERRKALAAGFDVHVPKPIDPGRLVSTVAQFGAKSAKSARKSR